MTGYKYDNLFARTIREARSKTPYNQTEAAAAIGMDRSHYASLETGSDSTRKRSVVNKIADFYGLDRDALYDLAPEINIRTARLRSQRDQDRASPGRPVSKVSVSTLSEEDAARYARTAEQFNIDLDDLLASLDVLSPDIVAWLKESPAHARQVRTLMSTQENQPHD